MDSMAAWKGTGIKITNKNNKLNLPAKFLKHSTSLTLGDEQLVLASETALGVTPWESTMKEKRICASAEINLKCRLFFMGIDDVINRSFWCWRQKILATNNETSSNENENKKIYETHWKNQRC